MSSTLCAEAGTGALTLFAKGAPEAVLERCTSVLAGDGGLLPMTPELRAELYAKVGGADGGWWWVVGLMAGGR